MPTKTRFADLKRALWRQSVLTQAHFELTKAPCCQTNVVVLWFKTSIAGLETKPLLNMLKSLLFFSFRLVPAFTLLGTPKRTLLSKRPLQSADKSAYKACTVAQGRAVRFAVQSVP